MTYHVHAFYRFIALDGAQLPKLRERIFDAGRQHEIQGLILLATEGVNGTVAGPPEGMREFNAALRTILGINELEVKENTCPFQPFRRFKVELREEIVSLRSPNLPKVGGRHGHLSPQEFHAMVGREDVVVVDTRNRYETRIGTFRNAVDPQIDRFSQFPEFLAQSGIPKDKTILMYCTGGIRCEKAIYAAEQLGYQKVFQLDGGILNYFAQIPEGGAFEGECFVFDNRVAVDAALQPTSRYRLCPHCGEPADESQPCVECGDAAFVCTRCREERGRHTCSKNCQYHYDRQGAQKRTS